MTLLVNSCVVPPALLTFSLWGFKFFLEERSMKKSYWAIFGIVLFVLILVIVIDIFLHSNKSDELSGDQIEMASSSQICTKYQVV